MFLAIAKKSIKDNKKAVYISHIFLAVFLFVVPALGAADGGPPKWESGMLYIVIQIFFLAYDWTNLKNEKVEKISQKNQN